jgi:hypothetical protein
LHPEVRRHRRETTPTDVTTDETAKLPRPE